MTLSEDQQRALVAQREREAIAVEMAGLRRDAERARWCERNEADVDWSDIIGTWSVVWVKDVVKRDVRCVRNVSRNAAIDAAMGGEHA